MALASVVQVSAEPESEAPELEEPELAESVSVAQVWAVLELVVPQSEGLELVGLELVVRVSRAPE